MVCKVKACAAVLRSMKAGMPIGGSHLERTCAAAGVNRDSGANALVIQGAICRWAGMWQLLQGLQRQVLTLQLLQCGVTSLHRCRAGEAWNTAARWLRWQAAVPLLPPLRAALCLTQRAAFVCTKGKGVVMSWRVQHAISWL